MRRLVLLTRPLLLTLFAAAACSSAKAPSSSSTASGGVLPTTSAPSRAAPGAGPSTAAPSTTAGAALAACPMLTASQIQAALGTAPGAGSETDGSGQAICEWQIAKPDGSGYGLELRLYSGRTDADWAQQRQTASAPTTTVSGLGDDAFSEVSRSGGIFDDLWVKRGSVNFRLEVLADVGVEPLRTLASDVLAHLG